MLNNKSPIIGFISAASREHFLQLLVALVLAILASAAQIGITLLMFRLLTGGLDTVIVFGQTISNQMIWGSVIILGILSAVLPYLSERYIVHQVVRFFKSSIAKVAKALTQTEPRFLLFSNTTNLSELTRLMTSEARYISLAYGALLRLMFPMTIFIFALVTLFILQPLFVGLMLLLVLPFAIIQFMVVRSGMQINRRLREAGGEHGMIASRLVRGMMTNFTTNRRGNTELLSNIDPMLNSKFPDVYGERLKLGINTRLMGDFGLVAIVIIVCILALTGNFNIEAIAQLLVFAILVRITLSNLSTFMTGTISIVSQYPFYENYVHIDNVMSKSSKDKKLEHKTMGQMNLLEEFAPFKRNVVFSKEPINWLLVYNFFDAGNSEIDTAKQVTQSFLASGYFAHFTDDMVKEIQLSPLTNPEAIKVMFPASEPLWPEIELLLKSTRPLSELWSKIPRKVKFLCAFQFAVKKKRGGSFIFLDGIDYSALTHAEKMWVDKVLESSRCIIVANRWVRPRLLEHIDAFYTFNFDASQINLLCVKGQLQDHETEVKDFLEVKSLQDVSFDEDSVAEVIS